MHQLRWVFVNPFSVILFVLGMISSVTGVFFASSSAENATTAIIISPIVLIGGMIRLVQELRTKNTARQLGRLFHEDIAVKREGEFTKILVEELVVGDIVLFSAGGRVPADIRLTKVTDLFTSQALITGESAVLEKNYRTHSHSSQIVLTQPKNLIFMATTVINDKGGGVVLAASGGTLYGGFARPDSDDKDSFQNGIDFIAWVVLRLMAVLVSTAFVLLSITGGKWLESFAFALSIAVGLMLEILPMVITAYPARGNLTISRKQTIIKNINAIQGFSSMDILCMGRTGMLTNESIPLKYHMDVLDNENAEVLDLALLNSFYHSGVHNPIDNMILACQTMSGRETYYVNLLTQYQKVGEIPSDYARRLISILITGRDGEGQLIIKGDIFRIVAHCSHVEYQGEVLPIEKGEIQSVAAVIDEMLQDGMRVIAVTRKNMEYKKQIIPAGETGMIPMGYLTLPDAPKKTAKASMAALERLKVAPKILIGGQMNVATSVCRRVEISSETVLTGIRLSEITDSKLSMAVEEIHVLTGPIPRQKIRLVFALHQNDHTVGFLGDGINDIPAPREANVGVLVDTTVNAIKDAADVVLSQRGLGVLGQGISEGRKTLINTLKYIRITTSSNFGNAPSVVCASAFLPFLPTTSAQILLLNLLYDVLCIALSQDNADEGETLSPRDWSSRTLGRFMPSFGLVSSLLDVMTFLFLYYSLCPMLCGGTTYLSLISPVLRLQYVSLFQIGWFLESMWTQVLILHFLQTRRVLFVQNRLSAPVICTIPAEIIAFTAITFADGALLLGLIELLSGYFVFLLTVALLHMLLTAVAGYFYQKKYHELTRGGIHHEKEYQFHPNGSRP